MPCRHWRESRSCTLVLLLIATLGALGSSSARTAEPEALEFSRVSMGGRIRVVVYPSGADPSASRITAVVAQAFEELDALEAVLSDWRPESELSRVSQAAGGDALPIGEVLAEALTAAVALAEATDGAFDPTVGPLTSLWRQAKEAGAAPPPAAVEAARTLVGWRDLQLTAPSPGGLGRARLVRPGMRLDLGGIGKGFAVDRLSAFLDRHDLPTHLIDFGSAMRAGDAPPGRDHWTIDAPGFGSLALCRSALAISGSDEQIAELDGEAVTHLTDPRPAAKSLGIAGPAAAAVTGPDGATADALATALCVVGARAAPDLARRFGRFGMSVVSPAASLKAANAKATLEASPEASPEFGPEPRPNAGSKSGASSAPPAAGVASAQRTPSRTERFSTPDFPESGARCHGMEASLHPLRRVLLPGHRAALEVASMRFVSEGLPTVTLVGVTHIGEAEFYAALERLFESQDLVLYESVMPSGVGGLVGVPPAERRERTRETMEVLAELLEAVRLKSRGLPAELADLAEAVRQVDTRFVRLVPEMGRDAWGHAILYERRFDDQGEAIDFELRSLGADGGRGGRGDAADIVVTRPAKGALAEEGIQANLADALGLQFQLRAIDYSKPNFRLADMSMAELEAALAARGADDGGLMGTLAGTSFPARMASMLLGLLKFADGLTGGALKEMIKAVLLELFADGEILAAAEQQVGKGFMEVILVERNAAALAGLRDVGPEAEVAVFYGAAHLPDLARRLEGEGYRLEDVTWFPAIEVDLGKAGLDRRQLEMLRREIKSSLKGRR